MRTGLHHAVRETLTQAPTDMLQRGILAACSGGADSTALLLLLHDLSEELSFPLEVVTINHGLRPEAGYEVEAVQAFSQGLGVPCHIRTVPVPDAREEAMRNFRLLCFKELLAERDLGIIATGHTAEDQAETLLMRLIRGSGLRGLTGMRVFSSPFLKPLLHIGREALRTELRGRGVPWAEDVSNRSADYFRNRVRHTILPSLRAENPNITATLCTTALNLAEELETLEQFLTGALPRPQPFEHGEVFLIDAITKLPAGAMAHLMRSQYARFCTGAQLERHHIEGIRAFLGGAQATPSLPGRIICERIGQWFYMGPHLAAPDFSVVLSQGAHTFTCTRGEGALVPDPHGGIYIPEDAWPLTLRVKRAGDRLRRKGMGEVRLKKVLAAIPRRIKERLLVLEGRDGTILWVECAGRAYDMGGSPHSLVWKSVPLRLEEYL